MKNIDSNKHAKAASLLALGVTREDPAYTPPSDEELALLLEAGFSAASVPGLDATRKSQVMDAIANDADTFNRWMSLVEAAETLELAGYGQQVKANTEKQQTGWFRSLFANPFKGLAATGGGLVAASALMLVVTTSDDLQSQIDGMYDHYGNQWASTPSSQSLTRSTSAALKINLSAEESILFAGVNTGLEKLGEPFTLPNLVNESALSATSDVDDTLAERLNIAGQIAALSYFKCLSDDVNPAYFTEAQLVLEELQPAFDEASDKTSKELNRQLKRSGNAESKVCRFSKLVISKVTL